jgi:DNA-binding NarL/FixJ family response regulator
MAIFVIDEHPLMREAIGMLIHRITRDANVVEMDRLSMVTQAMTEQGVPSLICMDLKLPDNSDAQGVVALKKRFPQTHLIVLSGVSAADYEELCIDAGADVFIQKSAGATEISSVLRLFLHNDLEPMAGGTAASIPIEKLSKRQKQLLVMIDKGMSNRDIAQSLDISEHTVKVHLWRLFKRLNVKSRSQASHLARTHGLL